MTTLQPRVFEGCILGSKHECRVEIVGPTKAFVHFTYNDKPYAMCLFDDQMNENWLLALCADYKRRNGSDEPGASYNTKDLIMCIAKHAISCLDRLMANCGGFTQVKTYAAALRVEASGVLDGTIRRTDEPYVTSIVLVVTTFILHSNTHTRE